MPGLFGAVGCRPECEASLRAHFLDAWEGAECAGCSFGTVGGHAHSPWKAVFTLQNGDIVAVDGELSLYRVAQSLSGGAGDCLVVWKGGRPSLGVKCAGNVALLRPGARDCFLLSDPSGCFPLYYSTAGGGLLFSSLLRPLVAALREVTDVKPDLVALLEYMRLDYMMAGRSVFADVKRVLPGQVIRYDTSSGRLTIWEDSDIWVGCEEAGIGNEYEQSKRCWEALVGGVMRSLDPASRVVLMMSSGWDSRTLLAALLAGRARESVACYSHGDLRSRELALTRRICADMGVDLRCEPLRSEDFGAEVLDSFFARVETVAYPEWLRAGRLLSEEGDCCVASGVLGEVLGGHYGRPMMQKGAKRVLALALEAGRRGQPAQDALDPPQVEALLRRDFSQKPWFLAEEVWAEIGDLQGAVNSDVSRSLERLASRGILTNHQLLEAFVTEHRGAQDISGQVLSCRASLDVAIPFADRDLLRLASRTPISQKVHNSLNRKILLRFVPELGRYSTAATLVPVDAPIAVQEASRVLRRVYESARWRLYYVSGGLVPFPRNSWWQLEFLRDGVVFSAILSDLRSPIWDRAAIRLRIKANSTRTPKLGWRSETALLSQHMLRIATMDRYLR